MVGTGYYTFVQTQRLYNIKSELECKLWTLGDYDVSMAVITCNKRIIQWGVLMVIEMLGWHHQLKEHEFE